MILLFLTFSMPCYSFPCCFLESKGGAVVRALASLQCGLGSNPGVDAICFVPNNLVKFNTVKTIRAEKYFSQLVRADKLSRLNMHGVVEGKMHLINELMITKAKIRHEPLEGTSALYTVYASFFKQRSDISHAKQARYTSFFNKGRTIRKSYWVGGGGGRGARSTKKVYSRKEKLNEKNSCSQLTLKIIHATA